jgi:phytoene dehydrogenase-like protein
VYESRVDLGGRARTREIRKHYFNLGPHALYVKGAAMRVFRELGVSVRGARVPVGGRAMTGRDLHTLPSGLMSLMSTGLFGWPTKLRALPLLARLPWIRIDRLRDVPLSAWLDRTTRDPALREYLAALFRLSSYAHDPERMSAGAAVRQLQLARGGVLYVHGGWDRIVRAVAATAVAGGARIRTNTRVAGIERDANGAVRALRLDNGTEDEVAAVIATGTPTSVAKLAGRDLHATHSLRIAADNAAPVRVATLELALSHLREPGLAFALGVDQPTYFSIHSHWAELAPPGGHTIHVMRYIAPGETIDAAAFERQLERQLDLMHPGWLDHVVDCRFAPGMVVSNALTRFDRPRAQIDVPEIPGMFVAGDWVGDGMLSDAAVESASRAAASVRAILAPAGGPAARASVAPVTVPMARA